MVCIVARTSALCFWLQIKRWQKKETLIFSALSDFFFAVSLRCLSRILNHMQSRFRAPKQKRINYSSACIYIFFVILSTLLHPFRCLICEMMELLCSCVSVYFSFSSYKCSSWFLAHTLWASEFRERIKTRALLLFAQYYALFYWLQSLKDEHIKDTENNIYPDPLLSIDSL